jgi:hypothetical protein
MADQYQELMDAVNSRAAVTGFTHNFYRYPARFSHQFAREVISCFSRPGDDVLDPFMGGGTAIVEALSLGRLAAGVDLNELAHFVATVKTTPLSPNDRETILEWLEKWSVCEIGNAPIADERVVNLPYHIERLFEGWLCALDCLPEPRQENFLRCALLKTGQWAIDCRDRIPTYAEIRRALKENVTAMLGGLDELVVSCQGVGVAKNKITGRRDLLCRSAVGLENEAVIRDRSSRFRLVVTSPPYYGVHVIYHRWQVRGRRETPAPYWIANLNDGNGLSYYTFGSRGTELGRERYFQTLLNSFRSIKQVLHPKAMVVQLVSFEEAAEQLPLYLDTMDAAGFREVEMFTSAGGERVWRNVPNRKWYSRMRKEEHDAATEVLLLHQPA